MPRETPSSRAQKPREKKEALCWVATEAALLALASLNLQSVQERQAPQHGGAVPGHALVPRSPDHPSVTHTTILPSLTHKAAWQDPRTWRRLVSFPGSGALRAAELIRVGADGGAFLMLQEGHV